MTLILSNDDVEKLLTMHECIAVMEEAYVELADGRGVSRTRSDCFTPTAQADAVYSLKSMDGVAPKFGVGAVRINSDIITWARRGVRGAEVFPPGRREEATQGPATAMCPTNSTDPVFFERWIEPGMHLSSIKRPEIEVKAVKRADCVIIHWNDPTPIHVAAKDVVIEEKVAGRGWQLAEEIDFDKLPTLPQLVVGRVEGGNSHANVTCFINNIGLGYQFAAAGSVVYRKAKECGLGHDVPTDWFTED